MLCLSCANEHIDEVEKRKTKGNGGGTVSRYVYMSAIMLLPCGPQCGHRLALSTDGRETKLEETDREANMGRLEKSGGSRLRAWLAVMARYPDNVTPWATSRRGLSRLTVTDRGISEHYITMQP